jgi:hypothetical protein
MRLDYLARTYQDICSMLLLVLAIAMWVGSNPKALVEQVVYSPSFEVNRIIHLRVPFAKLKKAFRYTLGCLQKYDGQYQSLYDNVDRESLILASILEKPEIGDR